MLASWAFAILELSMNLCSQSWSPAQACLYPSLPRYRYGRHTSKKEPPIRVRFKWHREKTRLPNSAQIIKYAQAKSNSAQRPNCPDRIPPKVKMNGHNWAYAVGLKEVLECLCLVEVVIFSHCTLHIQLNSVYRVYCYTTYVRRHYI